MREYCKGMLQIELRNKVKNIITTCTEVILLLLHGGSEWKQSHARYTTNQGNS